MSSVRVVIAVPLAAELRALIAAVDERVEVVYDPGFFPDERTIGDHHGGQQRTDADRDDFYAMIAAAQVLLGVPEQSGAGLRQAVEAAPGLRWVHAIQAGAGAFVTAADLSEQQLTRVTITSSAGVHAGPLAEFAVLGLLAGVQDAPRLVAQQRAHEWPLRIPIRRLAGSTVLVVGYGAIGRAIADRLRPFGADVIAVRRSAPTTQPVEASATGLVADDAIETAPGGLRVIGADRLQESIAQADHIVITVPGTADTAHLFDTEQFAAMRPGAVLVNVGRGSAINESALLEALRCGQVGFAALDVFETEPLPSDSPLWDEANVLISPHSAALDVGEERRVVELFCDNLRRYLADEPLRNLVEADRGY